MPEPERKNQEVVPLDGRSDFQNEAKFGRKIVGKEAEIG